MSTAKYQFAFVSRIIPKPMLKEAGLDEEAESGLEFRMVSVAPMTTARLHSFEPQRGDLF